MGRSIQDFDSGELEEIFEYLDDLRDSGETNMFGAGAYLSEQFPDLARGEELTVLKAWMNTFSETLPVSDRALNALEVR